MKLAISPIGWSNDDMHDLGGHIPLEECLSEMRAAGFAGCEAGHKFPRESTILKEVLKPYELQLVSAWYSLYFTLPECVEETILGFKKHMAFLKAMGAKVIVVCECGHAIHTQPKPVFNAAPIFSKTDWRALIDGLKRIGELALAEGMRVVYHHHMGTGINYTYDINQLMEHVEPDLLSLLLDTGHLTFAGGDCLELIKTHGPRIHHVHLKDIRDTVLMQVKLEALSFLDAVRQGVFTVPGDGSIHFPSIMKALKKVGYYGWYVIEAEQDPAKAHPLTYAKCAYDYIQSIEYA